MRIYFCFLKYSFHIDFENASNLYFSYMIDMDGLAFNTCSINVSMMKIVYVKIVYEGDVHICHMKFVKEIE